MINRVADVGRSEGYASELRVWPKKLAAGDGRLRERPDRHQAHEGVRDLLRQRRAQLEELVRKLVQRDRAGQANAVAAGVGDVDGETVRDLPLDIEIPLLYVALMLAADEYGQTLADEGVGPLRRIDERDKPIRERIAQTIL